MEEWGFLGVVRVPVGGRSPPHCDESGSHKIIFRRLGDPQGRAANITCPTRKNASTGRGGLRLTDSQAAEDCIDFPSVRECQAERLHDLLALPGKLLTTLEEGTD